MRSLLAFCKHLPVLPYYHAKLMCNWIKICMKHATQEKVQWWYPFLIPFWLIFIVGLLPNPFELIPFVTFLEIPDMLLTIIILITLQTGLFPEEKLAYRQEVTNFWHKILARPITENLFIQENKSPKIGLNVKIK